MRTTATIYRANCYFRVTDFKEEFYRKVIGPFCRLKLFKKGQVTDPVTYTKYWKVTHVFARSNHDQTEYRLPHSLFDEFLKFAINKGYKKSRIVIEDEEVIKPTKVSLAMKGGFENPRENQEEWIEYQLGPGGIKANEASTGLGKEQPNSALVKIPGGWKPIGDIKVGDYVIAPDGYPTKVTGVFPQGVKDIYKTTYEDGRVSKSGLEHQWLIYDVNSPLPSGFGMINQLRTVEEVESNRWRVVTTQELIWLLDDNQRRDKLYLPLTESELGEDKNLNRDTYSLGVWLTNSDDSTEKAIPNDFLLGSHEQRSGLVRGILDSDSVTHDSDKITFTTKHKKLSVGLVYLVRSLGGLASVNAVMVNDNKLFEVTIKHPNPESLFLSRFSDGEKSKLVSNPELKLRILDVQFSHQEEATCIQVEHPDSLYVTQDFVVTHNTYMALYTAVELGYRTLITIQPRYITTWLNDIGKTLEVSPDDVLVWEHTDLELLVENIEKGLIDPKIIILPLTRVTGYLKKSKLEPELEGLENLFTRMGIGFRIIDEAHESFHEVCLSMFFGNPEKTLMLSATLKSDDKVIDDMYKHMMPVKLRLKEPEPEHYIDVRALTYRICPRKYKYKTVQFGSYSDIAYEGSIYKSPVLTEFYYQLMKKMFEEYYLNVREHNTKCLFFFTLVKMSLKMLEFFRRDFPDLDFETYLGSLDKKFPTKYLEHEIIITTPGSCGTGKDIPGLVTVISPHTVFSSQRNKQMIGRLRDPKNLFQGRITPTFVFPVNSDIGKHRECYTKRKAAFDAKQKTFKLFDSNMELV